MTQNHLHMYLHSLETQFEGDCQAASMRIHRSREMRDVVRATEISIRPELRAVSRTLPGYRRMHAAAERRLEELLKEQLDALKAAPLAEAEALYLRYRQKDWQALRGAYATLYRRGEIQGQRLLHAKRSAPAS
ncbi:hypothetical protein AB4Y45_35525 [Paraburkholderia sp. EG287A]|uniref:hypothetical protein n=1 Tax=Paraburkholderia sp. EG287A TaxID=3237012 RepID=UPI0034D2D4CB